MKQRHSKQQKPTPQLWSSLNLRLCAVSIVLAAIVLATQWRALSAQSLFIDDDQYLTENPLVLNPSWPAAGQFLEEVLRPSTVDGYYQPLAMISLMVDTALGGDPNHLRAYHRTSLALHVCNSVLVMLLLYQLFGQVWPAALMALLFGIHPLTVEPIPWVGERKTLLASFFALISLVAYVRYARIIRKSEIGNWKSISYLLCIICYVLALMSKPTTTPLPLVMLLLDYWPLRRLNHKALLEKIPLIVICVVFAIITFISQGQTAGVVIPSQRSPMRISFILCHNIVFYLWHLIWPMNLTPYYAFPDPFDLSHPRVIFGVIGTLVLLIGLAISFRYTAAPLTGWLLFFVAIFPTLGVIGFTEVIASDKYVYLPMLGFLLIGSWGWQELWARARTVGLRSALAAICLLIAIAEIYLTQRQLTYWQNTEGLYRYALTKAPNSPGLHNDLGLELVTQGRIDDGITEYRRTLEIKPDHANAHNNLGIALAQSGQIEEATQHLQQAVQLKPNLVTAHFNFALALSLTRHTEEAMHEYREVIRLRSSDVDAHYNLGTLLEQAGKLDDAISEYREALRFAPQNEKTRKSLNAALKKHP